MKPLFNVTVVSLEKIHDMPDTWTENDYLALLKQLDVDGIEGLSGPDLVEMTMMALQDLDPDDAADAVLEYKLRTSITAGARRNIVQDLREDHKPWEEASDIKLHARIFAAAVLLQKAVPAKFPKPGAMHLTLQVTALNPEAGKLISEAPQAAFVTRLLADAMSEDCILERLFDEQLASHSFPEAKGIIWQADFTEEDGTDPQSRTLSLYSSVHWLKAMDSISDFQSTAYNDTEALH
ncbi:hypothetical protein [Emcibacter sp.]|uniref:hypothetical protein n=1 Tax=Emcibacter sp. TaxID=1979954 RepID=UPI002AA63192|nr:hypothetical protein [Emcibacter sp.]